MIWNELAASSLTTANPYFKTAAYVYLPTHLADRAGNLTSLLSSSDNGLKTA